MPGTWNSPLFRPVLATLVASSAVAVLALASPDAARAGRTSSDAAELLALLSLRDTASYEEVAPRLRSHFRIAIDGFAHRVSRTRSGHSGWLSEVVIESNPASRGDEESLRESWGRLLAVARARFGVASEGSKHFPSSIDLVRGTASTHRWLLPGRSIALQTSCVPRTPRGGRTCSALLRVNQTVTYPASLAR